MPFQIRWVSSSSDMVPMGLKEIPGAKAYKVSYLKECLVMICVTWYRVTVANSAVFESFFDFG